MTNLRLERVQSVIDLARDWRDLTRLLDSAQHRYERGDLDAATVTAIAERCVVRAREVPPEKEV